MNDTGFDPRFAASLFDAVIDSDIWAPALSDFVPRLGARSSIVMSVNVAKGGSFEGVWTDTVALKRNMVGFYAANCAAHEASGVEIVRNSDPLTVLDECDLWPDEADLYQRPDFVALREEFGVNHRICAKVSENSAWFNTVAVQFDESRGPATPSERAVFSAYLPFFSQVVRLSTAFAALRERYRAVLSVLDKYLCPVLVADERGHIIVANVTARDLMDRSDGVRLDRDGRLRFSDAGAAGGVANAIARAARTALGEDVVTRSMIPVARPSGGDPYLIEVSPLRDADREIDPTFKGAMLKIFDPSRNAMVSVEGFDRVFGLTKAEFAVAELLAAGVATADIAEIRGVSFETVRTQIKAVLRKSGCASRAAFVRKALSAHAPVAV